MAAEMSVACGTKAFKSWHLCPRDSDFFVTGLIVLITPSNCLNVGFLLLPLYCSCKERTTTMRFPSRALNRSLIDALTSVSSVNLGSWIHLCPDVDAPPGGNLPVHAYLRHSMIVV